MDGDVRRPVFKEMQGRRIQMSEKHTPEPWNGNTHQGLGAKGKVLSKADYHRATDCVNACAGIEDPAAYIADLQSRLDLAVKALEKISQSPHPTNSNEFGIWEEVARYIAQNTLEELITYKK